MDPRQRSAERRRLLRIGFCLLLGLTMVLGSVVLHSFGFEDEPHYWRADPVLGFFFGLAFIVAAFSDLVHRLRTGPTQPGKRARY